jgi:hypothetical protein
MLSTVTSFFTNFFEELTKKDSIYYNPTKQLTLGALSTTILGSFAIKKVF